MEKVAILIVNNLMIKQRASYGERPVNLSTLSQQAKAGIDH